MNPSACQSTLDTFGSGFNSVFAPMDVFTPFDPTGREDTCHHGPCYAPFPTTDLPPSPSTTPQLETVSDPEHEASQETSSENKRTSAASLPDIGALLLEHGEELLARYNFSAEQLKALRDMALCRTYALGGKVQWCEGCGYEHFVFRSCGNRHCPKCSGRAQQRWVRSRLEQMLPIKYFHATLTLPAHLRSLVMGNQKLLYTLLFRSVKEALEALAAESRWIGGRIGFTAVLHTWAKDLQFHPHIHVIVTGGGLRPDGSWKFAQDKFLFPVRKLSYEFKHRFMKGLAKLYKAGELSFQGSTEHLSDPVEFFALKDKLMRKKWVVDIRKPFFEGRHVIQYLGRYTHRVAVSNRRLLEVNDTHVRLRTRDSKSVRLTIVEFLRRLSLHVLPEGFTKIRHYGLHAPRHKYGLLRQAEAAIAKLRAEGSSPEVPEQGVRSPLPEGEMPEQEEQGPPNCPKCGGPLYEEDLNESDCRSLWQEWTDWFFSHLKRRKDTSPRDN